LEQNHRGDGRRLRLAQGERRRHTARRRRAVLQQEEADSAEGYEQRHHPGLHQDVAPE
jgi:hypothetical protein